MVRDYVYGLRNGFGVARRSLGRNGRLGNLQYEQTRFEARDYTGPGDTCTYDTGASNPTTATATTAAAAATGANANASKEVVGLEFSNGLRP